MDYLLVLISVAGVFAAIHKDAPVTTLLILSLLILLVNRPKACE